MTAIVPPPQPVDSPGALHGTPSDPFRLFFPLGIVLGVAGVSIWPAYWLGLTPGFSGRAHAFVQADGFLYAFVAGFLLTAIPRFTGTDVPGRSEERRVGQERWRRGGAV